VLVDSGCRLTNPPGRQKLLRVRAAICVQRIPLGSLWHAIVARGARHGSSADAGYEDADGDAIVSAIRRQGLSHGVLCALLAAVLFGASTPFVKLLLGQTHPVLMAGLLYAGSGIGLSILRRLRGDRVEAPLTRRDTPWLGGAVFFGGVLAPVLLVAGLRSTPASVASLLLNLEGVFTALLAWFVFRENFDRRIAAGMLSIVAGGAVLSWSPGATLSLPMGALAIGGACLCWGIDNNLTQKVSGGDPLRVAAIKGAVAGSVNLLSGVLIGAPWPSLPVGGLILVVGFIGYGVSLSLFVVALRHIGTARTGAYFSIAPFIGAAASVPLLGERLELALIIAAALMAAGVWLHVTELHEHEHEHERLDHTHRHVHDDHPRHAHPSGDPGGEPHSHEHVHPAMAHSHRHYPDIHHRHRHG
jgi:drug/metabolite transporter (DMT)-like permease